MSGRIEREELVETARGFVRPGVSVECAFVLAFAALSGEPLDADAFDDGAVILRAERLVADGLGLSDAVTTARAELITWQIPGGTGEC